MEIRKTTAQDLPRLNEIFASAKAFMRSTGNLTQWQGNLPEALIPSDIEAGTSYVCVSEGEVVATFCFFVGDDPTYAEIHDGAWLDAKPYGVIHRIAVAKHGHGIAGACIDYCKQLHSNIRIDTHKDNAPMHKLLEKHGFARCGTIYLASGDPRIAYQTNII